MGILAIIASGLKALAAAIGWGKQDQALHNTPAEQANAEAAELQGTRDQATDAINKGDTAELNKLIEP